MYLCKKIVILYAEFKTNNYFLSFHSNIFISTLKLFLRWGGVTHLSKHILMGEGITCKLNRDGLGEGSKIGGFE